MMKVYSLFRRFFPSDDKRALLRRAVSYARRNVFTLGFVKQYLKHRIQRLDIFVNHYEPEDFSEIILYTDRQDILPGYPLRSPLTGHSHRQPLKVTLISTLRNERKNAPIWLDQILAQTRLPDEIILVDAGSTDGTYEILEAAAAACPVPLRVLREPGANIARGRNIAIRAARYPVIAATEFGCRPKPDWLEKIVMPFECDPATQVSGGFYEGILENGQAFQRSVLPDLSQLDPKKFIPSSRSIAFTQDAWAAAHGYPEWLTLTGEDTYFGSELKRFCDRWAFVPEAVVQWEVPATPFQYLKKLRRWCFGDGEAGMRGDLFYGVFARIIRLLLYGFTGALLLALLGLFHLWWGILLIVIGGISYLVYYSAKKPENPSLQNWLFELACECSQLIGYLQGFAHRRQADLRRFSQSRGLVFILAGSPIEDTRVDLRGAQVLQEYLRNNYVVVFVNHDEDISPGIHAAHPNLLSFNYKEFNVEAFFRLYEEAFCSKPKFVLVEFPLPEYLTLSAALQKHGLKVA